MVHIPSRLSILDSHRNMLKFLLHGMSPVMQC